MPDPIKVNVDNFVRAETDRIFGAILRDSGLNDWFRDRQPTAIEQQPVIRQNRDTLYIVRLYRPRPEILDGSWTFPSIEERGG